jgi:hypothetical protein
LSALLLAACSAQVPSDEHIPRTPGATTEASTRWIKRRRRAGKVEEFFVEEDLAKIKGTGL